MGKFSHSIVRLKNIRNCACMSECCFFFHSLCLTLFTTFSSRSLINEERRISDIGHRTFTVSVFLLKSRARFLRRTRDAQVFVYAHALGSSMSVSRSLFSISAKNGRLAILFAPHTHTHLIFIFFFSLLLVFVFNYLHCSASFFLLFHYFRI